MNFSASSNDKPVFPASEQARYKGAAAVLPPPQFLGMVGQLPPPTPIGFNDFSSKGSQSLGSQDVAPAFSVKVEPTVETSQFPVFSGEPKSMFGLITDHEPFMLMNKLERVLEFASAVDYQCVNGEPNVIRGRYFGDLNNTEFEVRVFTWTGPGGQSYAEFNRWCGDGWAFTNFVEKVLLKFGENVPTRPSLPPIPTEYGQATASPADLTAMLSDVEESYQDIAEHAAAELAMQTKNEICRRMCEEIDGFCPRILKIVNESSNCAIVRSLLICLANMSQLDGLTKRIVGQQSSVLRTVGDKWSTSQSMCGGLYEIAPSQEVARHVDILLMA